MNQETARVEYIKKATAMMCFGASFFSARDQSDKLVFLVLHSRGLSFSSLFFVFYFYVYFNFDRFLPQEFQLLTMCPKKFMDLLFLKVFFCLN